MWESYEYDFFLMNKYFDYYYADEIEEENNKQIILLKKEDVIKKKLHQLIIDKNNKKFQIWNYIDNFTKSKIFSYLEHHQLKNILYGDYVIKINLYLYADWGSNLKIPHPIFNGFDYNYNFIDGDIRSVSVFGHKTIIKEHYYNDSYVEDMLELENE